MEKLSLERKPPGGLKRTWVSEASWMKLIKPMDIHQPIISGFNQDWEPPHSPIDHTSALLWLCQ